MNSLRFLDVNDVLAIHRDTLENEGGRRGIRDIALIESAVATPMAFFAGQYLHPDIVSMAASLMFSLIGNHGFVDGNKRVGTLAALVFLDVNGIETFPSAQELERVALGVASGAIDKDELTRWWASVLTP